MPSTGRPSSNRPGSLLGEASSYTLWGPPLKMMAWGAIFLIASSLMVPGWISQYTWHSRIRRAISCVYCEPQSRIRTLCRAAMMALPLTWRPGAANPFAEGLKMRSIPVCHVDHDLGRSAQGGLERAQAAPTERALGGGAAPEIDDPAARVEGSAESALLGHALRARQIFVRYLALHEAIERAAYFERGFAGVVVAGADFDHQRGGSPSADDRGARRRIQLCGVE